MKTVAVLMGLCAFVEGDEGKEVKALLVNATYQASAADKTCLESTHTPVMMIHTTAIKKIETPDGKKTVLPNGDPAALASVSRVPITSKAWWIVWSLSDREVEFYGAKPDLAFRDDYVPDMAQAARDGEVPGGPLRDGCYDPPAGVHDDPIAAVVRFRAGWIEGHGTPKLTRIGSATERVVDAMQYSADGLDHIKLKDLEGNELLRITLDWDKLPGYGSDDPLVRIENLPPLPRDTHHFKSYYAITEHSEADEKVNGHGVKCNRRNYPKVYSVAGSEEADAMKAHAISPGDPFCPPVKLGEK